jgi:hypothetical protein
MSSGKQVSEGGSAEDDSQAVQRCIYPVLDNVVIAYP